MKPDRAVPNQPAEVSCTGKQRFESLALAQQVRSRKGRADKLSVYRCQHCAGWHLGRAQRGRAK